MTIATLSLVTLVTREKLILLPFFFIFFYQFLLSEPFLTIAKCSHPESAQLTKTKAEKAKKKLTEAKSAEEEEREAFCQRRDERIHNSPPQVAGVVVVVVGVAC